MQLTNIIMSVNMYVRTRSFDRVLTYTFGPIFGKLGFIEYTILNCHAYAH